MEFLNLNSLQVVLVNPHHLVIHDFLLELTRQIGPIKKNIEMVYPLPDDYAQEVFIYSNSAIFFHWIQKGGVETPEEIAKIFLRMTV